MIKVLISILGMQEADGEEEKIELVTEGEYSFGDDLSTLSYLESSITGMEGTTTTFLIEPHTVTLTREGTVTSQMLFQRGKTHVFLYSTPYGSSTMSIATKHLSVRSDEHSGHMEINYSLDVDNVFIGSNKFIIDFREA